MNEQMSNKNENESTSIKPRIIKFIISLLADKKYKDIIKWLDIDNAIFTFTEPNIVAKLWGKVTENSTMTYDKFSRALRYCYKKNYLEHMEENFTFKFI